MKRVLCLFYGIDRATTGLIVVGTLFNVPKYVRALWNFAQISEKQPCTQLDFLNP